MFDKLTSEDRIMNGFSPCLYFEFYFSNCQQWIYSDAVMHGEGWKIYYY